MTEPKGKKVYTAEELAGLIDADLFGEKGVEISGVNSLELAGRGDVSFVGSVKYEKKAEGFAGSGLLVKKKIEDLPGVVQFIVGDVDRALISVLNLFAPALKVQEGVHGSAVIDEGAEIGKNVSIGPGCCIESGVRIGENSIIGPNCWIGQNSSIGKNTRLYANVSVYHNCSIGNSCVIQAGASIGSIGFGYSFVDGAHQLIPHNGGVVIEDCVDIGANSCVDRAKFSDTVVGAGSKIDNLVQIAHNVIIGKCCILVAGVAIAGSCEIGNGVVLGGQVGVADNAKIGDGVMVGAQSGVVADIDAGMQVLGSPPQEVHERIRVLTIIKNLPKLKSKINSLEKKVKQFEIAKNDKK